MSKIIYLVTYDLEIYSHLEIWDKEYKHYNKNTGCFEVIGNKPKNLDQNSVEIDHGIIKILLKKVFYSKEAAFLEDDVMKWYLNFIKEAHKNPTLLNNNELLYNLLVIKAQLLGLPLTIAKQLYATYIDKRMQKVENLISVDKILEVLNKHLDDRIYWIPNVEKELQKEFMIIDDIMRNRASSPNYKYENFEQRYLKVCNDGYIKKIMLYNSDSSNLFAKGLAFKDQKEFLLTFFEETTEEIIQKLAEEEYPYFRGNFDSRKVLLDNLKKTLLYSMKFWD